MTFLVEQQSFTEHSLDNAGVILEVADPWRSCIGVSGVLATESSVAAPERLQKFGQEPFYF